MTAPLKSIEGTSIADAMADIGRRAKAAARTLALSPAPQRDAALAAMAKSIRDSEAGILAANAEDVAEAKAAGDERRVSRPAHADAEERRRNGRRHRGRARPADPVGAVTESWTRPNGMTIERVRVPLGVIGVIYESRPNVTADAAVLCLKAGNAVILRGGSESFRSARAIHAALVEGLRAAGLARRSDPARADARPRRGRDDARGPRRRYRRDRAARRQGPGRRACRPRRACRCSRISKAWCTSMSTRPPTSTWRRRSC